MLLFLRLLLFEDVTKLKLFELLIILLLKLMFSFIFDNGALNITLLKFIFKLFILSFAIFGFILEETVSLLLLSS